MLGFCVLLLYAVFHFYSLVLFAIFAITGIATWHVLREVARWVYEDNEKHTVLMTVTQFGFTLLSVIIAISCTFIIVKFTTKFFKKKIDGI